MKSLSTGSAVSQSIKSFLLSGPVAAAAVGALVPAAEEPATEELAAVVPVVAEVATAEPAGRVPVVDEAAAVVGAVVAAVVDADAVVGEAAALVGAAVGAGVARSWFPRNPPPCERFVHHVPTSSGKAWGRRVQASIVARSPTGTRCRGTVRPTTAVATLRVRRWCGEGSSGGGARRRSGAAKLQAGPWSGRSTVCDRSQRCPTLCPEGASISAERARVTEM